MMRKKFLAAAALGALCVAQSSCSLSLWPFGRTAASAEDLPAAERAAIVRSDAAAGPVSSSSSSPSSSEVADGLAAVVNGTPITHSEVRDVIRAQEMLLRRQYPGGGSAYQRELAELRKTALQDLIDRQLMLDAFEGKGGVLKEKYLDDDINRVIIERFGGDRKKFLEELATSGMTHKKFRELREKMLIVQYMRAEQARQIPPPTPQERDAYFREHANDFREKSYVKLRMITIPKVTATPEITPEQQLELAREIRQRITKGADFASEARTYSVDSRADEGGDRGWIDDSILKPDLTEAAFDLKKGELSDVIDDGAAYYIMWAEDTRPGSLKPRSEIEDDLNTLVLQEKRRKAYDDWIERLRSKANIRVY